MKCVTVYVKGIEAGVLARFRHGGYEFRYTREYRQSTRPSVAFSIPKRKAVHRSQVLFPFFYGLLAEGAQKRMQCRTTKTTISRGLPRLAAKER